MLAERAVLHLGWLPQLRHAEVDPPPGLLDARLVPRLVAEAPNRHRPGKAEGQTGQGAWLTSNSVAGVAFHGNQECLLTGDETSTLR